MKKAFALAALAILLPSALALTGCTNSLYENGKTKAGETSQTAPVEIKTIIKGNFTVGMDSGAYMITLPKEQIGSPHDLPCILMKDVPFGVDSGRSGLDCDWDAAYGLRQQAPTPAP